MKTKLVAVSAVAAVAAAGFAGTAAARDQVKVAGSSTVLPYANIVAEQYGKAFSKFKTPIIESGGSSAGLKLFCQGLGPNTIDVANASRKIRAKEVKACAKAGVKNIVEVSFGYDGIVFATDVKVVRPGLSSRRTSTWHSLPRFRSTARWSTTRTRLGKT